MTDSTAPDLREDRGDLQAFGGHQEIVDGAIVAGGRELDDAEQRIGQTFEEVGDRGLEGLSDLIQLGGADAVGATFVLLDLLERQLQSVGQVFLADAQDFAAHADAGADVQVDRIGLMAGVIRRVGCRAHGLPGVVG
ncbi:MAG: hypothetical protein JWN64_622 [Parcubacteria group bacterium]|nr:hypothetical protein [Parcubacteria group bacterium]